MNVNSAEQFMLKWTVACVANALGLSWWAKVRSEDPQLIYWVGPFLRRRTLEHNLLLFLRDLQLEGAQDLTAERFRCRRSEPLTYPPYPANDPVHQGMGPGR